MTTDVPATGLQLRSLVTASGEVVLSLASVPVPEPRAHEVLVRIEAAPIHPSDLGLLLGGAEFSRGRSVRLRSQPGLYRADPRNPDARLCGEARRVRAGRQ